MTEIVDVFYQETNYVTLLIFWLLIDVYFVLLHVSFIFECLMYFLFIILYYVYDFINNNNNNNIVGLVGPVWHIA